MPLYFAYGSNMDQTAMLRRCPASKLLGAARLVRHRFIITREGYASVLRDPRRTVWGVLWDLAFPDLPALDRYESVGTGLYVKINQPVLSRSGPRQALVYVARSSEPGTARPGYVEDIVAAARAAGLPGEHLRDLEGWLPQTRGAGGAAPVVRPTRTSPLDRGEPAAKPWRWEP